MTIHPSFSDHRITTDGHLYRLERGFFSVNPKTDPIWEPISIEMTSFAEAQQALERAKNPPVWRPVST